MSDSLHADISIGTRVVRLGGSVDMRESVTWHTASITLAGTDPNNRILTVVTQNPHNLHERTPVFISCQEAISNPVNSLLSLFQFGPVTTVTDAVTFQMAYNSNPNMPNGTVTTTGPDEEGMFFCSVVNRFSTASVHRETNQRLKGALLLVANMSTGQLPTRYLKPRVDWMVQNLKFDVLMGTFAIGDSYGAGISPEDTLADLHNIFQAVKPLNCQILVELSAGTSDTGSKNGTLPWQLKMRALLYDYARTTGAGQVYVYDPSYWSIDPNSGNIFPNFLRISGFDQQGKPSYDLVHPNRIHQRRKSIDLSTILTPRIVVPTTDQAVLSVNDIYIATTGPSTNVVDCSFNTAPPRTAPGSNSLGTCYVEITTIAFSGAGTSKVMCTPQAAVSSPNPPPPSTRGIYQDFEFRPLGTNPKGDTFQIFITGTLAGTGPLYKRVVPGQMYVLALEAEWLSPFPNDVIQYYEILVVADVTYPPPPTTPNYRQAQGVLAAAVSNTTDSAYIEQGFLIGGSSSDDLLGPFKGLHLTEPFMIPKTTDGKLNNLAIQINVVIAGPNTTGNPATLRIGRVALRQQFSESFSVESTTEI